MSSNPFAEIIAAAEQRELEAEQAAAAKRAEDEKLRQERSAQAAAEREAAEAKRRQERIWQFGKSFLNSVATRVVKPDWKPDFIRLVQQYSEGLLMQHPVDLPKIDAGTTKAILDRFAYGLELYSDTIPEGLFYGQQLLAEREAAKAETKRCERLRITEGSKPKVVTRSNGVVDIDAARKRLTGSATTPKGKKTPAHYRQEAANA